MARFSAALASALGLCFALDCGGERSHEPMSICPSAIQPTFDSINAKLLQTSCGVDGSGCHSRQGAAWSGDLDLADNPYRALLGPDGLGSPATNQNGTEQGLRRVVPGKPEESFLIIKLGLKSRD